MPVTPEAAAPSAAAWLQPYTVEHGIPAGKGSLTVLDFAAPGTAPPAWGPEAQAAEQRELQARAAALRAAEQAKYRRVDVPLVTLNDGTRLPAVGLGTWKAAKGEVQSAVHLALQAGYRHIDCASVYQNEEEVGEALGYALSRGLVSRQDLYICSKVWWVARRAAPGAAQRTWRGASSEQDVLAAAPILSHEGQAWRLILCAGTPTTGGSGCGRRASAPWRR